MTVPAFTINRYTRKKRYGMLGCDDIYLLRLRFESYERKKKGCVVRDRNSNCYEGHVKSALFFSKLNYEPTEMASLFESGESVVPPASPQPIF